MDRKIFQVKNDFSPKFVPKGDPLLISHFLWNLWEVTANFGRIEEEGITLEALDMKSSVTFEYDTGLYSLLVDSLNLQDQEDQRFAEVELSNGVFLSWDMMVSSLSAQVAITLSDGEAGKSGLIDASGKRLPCPDPLGLDLGGQRLLLEFIPLERYVLKHSELVAA
ncbi:MAG: hypothetical protein WC302_00225 [Candidatus Paceibacterota bacterium]|jgi:hypothetical protein